MPETVTGIQEADRAAAWGRDLRERVGTPLRPERLGSVLLIVPGNSGDVALATTLVRWVKGRNPRCRVLFAVKRSNLPLLAMCPGVDEALEIPTLPPGVCPSRRSHLAEHAGRADAVVFPVCVDEDADLLARLNFLEAMWLLAGVPDGPPPRPHRLWLTPPDDPALAAGALARSLDRAQAARLLAGALRQPGRLLGRILRLRRVRDVGWKDAPKAARSLLQNALLVRGLAARPDPHPAARRFVIVSSEATAVPPALGGLFDGVIGFLRSQGRVVLHNVLDPANAAPGTVPLVCTYAEFLALRRSGVPFVGWRSGLCDIAAAAPAPMAVLYPPTMAGSSLPGLRTHCGSVVGSFGFAAMGVDADCVELVCDGAAGPDLDALATILDERPYDERR